jgi:hypothetical protein
VGRGRDDDWTGGRELWVTAVVERRQKYSTKARSVVLVESTNKRADAKPEVEVSQKQHWIFGQHRIARADGAQIADVKIQQRFQA